MKINQKTQLDIHLVNFLVNSDKEETSGQKKVTEKYTCSMVDISTLIRLWYFIQCSEVIFQPVGVVMKADWNCDPANTVFFLSMCCQYRQQSESELTLVI